MSVGAEVFFNPTWNPTTMSYSPPPHPAPPLGITYDSNNDMNPDYLANAHDLDADGESIDEESAPKHNGHSHHHPPPTSESDADDSGYDKPEDDDDDDDHDDDGGGAYADKEYGAKKEPSKKKPRASSSTSAVRPKSVIRPASSSDADSDSGAHAHKKKKKQRASADEVRVSNRSNRIPNYVDNVQDFERYSNSFYVDPNIQYQEEDEIEAVLGHSREEGREDDPEDKWYENMRFHIKWKNFSHLHNTAETFEFLKRFRGLKRVDNYIRAYKSWQVRLAAPGLSREDAEALHLDKKHEKEELDTFCIVERIVAHREPVDGDMEYFCKWQGLNYDHSTWELQKDVNAIAKDQIADYHRRETEGEFPYILKSLL